MMKIIIIMIVLPPELISFARFLIYFISFFCNFFKLFSF